jgi:putative Mg2+ transporter-C (MgtC) family protein
MPATFDSSVDLAGLARLVLAIGCGGALGWPSRKKPGGLRTHALVCAGATLFSLTARHLTGPGDEGLVRVIQGVANGIGFIGAAAVLKHQRQIHGVSVAASIWISAAVGCELALGQVVFALLSVVVLTIMNVVLDAGERRFLGFHHTLVDVEGEPRGGKRD